jgi:SAM-dependent methyltransferase
MHYLIRGLSLLERLARVSRVRLENFHQKSLFRSDEGPASDLAKANNAAAWETEYLTPISPVTGLSSPVARAVAALTHPGEMVLEAGCGSATLSAELATCGRKIHLCDFSEKILRRATKLFTVSQLVQPGVTVCDLTRPLPWQDRAIDVVWSSGVLEHWTDEEMLPVVREMARISRRCVISLIPYAGCVLYRLGKFLAEESGRWPYGREIPRETLKPMFEKAGLYNIRESIVWSDAAPGVISLADGEMYETIKRWWQSLSSDDPARVGQGYLMLTVGYRDHSSLPENLTLPPAVN